MTNSKQTADVKAPTVEQDRLERFFAVQTAMRAELASKLPLLGLMLCLLAGIHAALPRFFGPAAGSGLSSFELFAAANCAGLAVFALFTRLVKLPSALVNPAVALLLGAVLIQILLSMYQLASASQTTLVILVMTCAGSLLLSRPWFAVMAGLGLGGWAYVAMDVGNPQTWGSQGLALLLAVAFSAVVQHSRLGSIHQFFRYKLEREEQERRLNTAIGEAQTNSERFQMFSEATLDGIIRLDKGMITDTNKAAVKMFGMAREDLLGKNIIDLIAPEHRIGAKDALSMAAMRPVETVCIKQDGTSFPVELVNRAVETERQRTHLLVFRNNSARHEMDQDRKRHQTGLEAQNRRLAGLARLATLPIEGDALPSFLDESLELVASCLPSEAGCALIMWDASKGSFVTAATNARGAVNPPDQMAHELGRDAVSWVCANNEALMVGMIGDDALGVRSIFPDAAVQAYAAIPVRNTEGTFGVLFALQSYPRDWSREDSNFLQTVSRMISTAAINSALVEQLRSLSGVDAAQALA